MEMKAASRVLIAATALLALGACDGVKKQLGMAKQKPDEFRVVSRAPLSLPPDFALRPPEPGATRPQEGTTVQQARTAVFRADGQGSALDEVAPGDTRSRGERALLLSAGADRADPTIRQTVDNETSGINESSESFIDTLVFWREAEKPGVIVDAEAESARLRENAALGRAATVGTTPTIERKKKALLEDIF